MIHVQMHKLQAGVCSKTLINRNNSVHSISLILSHTSKFGPSNEMDTVSIILKNYRKIFSIVTVLHTLAKLRFLDSISAFFKRDNIWNCYLLKSLS